MPTAASQHFEALANGPHLPVATPKSVAHYFALACVWLAVASSFLVFSEPAPTDALTMGLFILLPAIGLFDAHRKLVVGATLWLIVSASTIISTFVSRDVDSALSHSLVTFYLYGACFLFAGFVAKNPYAHTRLILNAYVAATIVAAVVGIAGYLDMFPGAYEMLTRFDRASGTFKDPNVFGPFLIPGLLMALHTFLTLPLHRGPLPLLAASIIAIAILLSFSRGAWAATAIALAIYGFVYLHAARHHAERMKLVGLVLLGSAILGVLLAIALKSDGVAQLLQERAALTQPYDEGPDGRFGGQLKAVGIILENPLGIGAQAFTIFHHHEEAHNVYLSVMMSAGWIGGLLYFLICAGTLAYGFWHALKPTKTQYMFAIAYAALAGTIIEGALIDTDHWRHFYLLMGIVWGLMASDRHTVGITDLVRDDRSVRRQKALGLAPPSRGVRIVAPLKESCREQIPNLGPNTKRRPTLRDDRVIKPTTVSSS